jgi:argininosuccinate lyase
MDKDFSLSTDLAEYLTLKDIPFVESHNIVGAIVKKCEKENKKLNELTLREFKEFSQKFSDDIFSYLSLKNSVERKKTSGSTGKISINGQIKIAERIIKV